MNLGVESLEAYQSKQNLSTRGRDTCGRKPVAHGYLFASNLRPTKRMRNRCLGRSRERAQPFFAASLLRLAQYALIRSPWALLAAADIPLRFVGAGVSTGETVSEFFGGRPRRLIVP